MRILTFASLALFAAMSFAGEGPPTSDGVISNPTLVENSSIAKAQAIGAITLFMGKGSQECDSDGKNCKSMFGNDDSMDVTGAQMSAQSTTGIQAFSFQSGNTADERMDTNTIASQMGTLVMACGDWSAKNVAGIAFKLNECTVNYAGDAQITFQVCTAPARGNPVEPPERTVNCSTDPTSPNFRPPVGYSCARPACSTAEQGSLNGWSAPITLTYQQSVAESGTEDQKSKNGLALAFYPALGGGVPGDFASDSDNMTAVKVVQTAINKDTHQSALGLRVAFRHKTKVTKEMMIQGASSVPNPGEHSAAWDTITKLQGNALIPQYQATYAKNGSECMQQITEGLATDGIVSVCDQSYTNESGIRPGALTAQMAGEGQNCGTTAQCLNEVVNTNTWTQTCNAEVPLSIRKCTTKQDYELETLSYTRTRNKEVCLEERTNAIYSCRTETIITEVRPKSCAIGSRLVDTSKLHAPGFNDPYVLFRVTCVGENAILVQVGTSMRGVEFDTAPLYGFNYFAVNQVLNMEPFASSSVQVGQDCVSPPGWPNTFAVQCSDSACKYSIQIGHSGLCKFAQLSPYLESTTEFGFDPVLSTVNACASYEAAR